ncbi:hypothetical protein TNCV_3818771 [Trichonephila clavipes]|nr:hypothetical protein TNCV_3818771 [Trichonephila clavipes]
MNETTQQERTTQLGSRNETTQLVSRNETTQLCTAFDRLQPPATAYNRLQPPTTACNRLQPPATACNRRQPPATACTAFTAESAFSTYSRCSESTCLNHFVGSSMDILVNTGISTPLILSTCPFLLGTLVVICTLLICSSAQ